MHTPAYNIGKDYRNTANIVHVWMHVYECYPPMFRMCRICVFDRFSHTENDLFMISFPCIERKRLLFPLLPQNTNSNKLSEKLSLYAIIHIYRMYKSMSSLNIKAA